MTVIRQILARLGPVARPARRRGRSLLAIPATALVFCSGGCGLLDVGEDERLGLLRLDAEAATIYVPRSVERGERFAVNFYTFGGGCVSRGRTELSIRGLEATIAPYDVHSGAGTCTDEIAFLDHTIWLRFDLEGTATIRVHGRGEPGDHTVVREFEVIVQSRDAIGNR
jgi:hypothetical protein